ncbi:MAG: phage baseplate assembly protein V [Novosphingobium sp.]
MAMLDRQQQEIRRLHKKAAAADRRIAVMSLSGKVAEKDPSKRMLRLRIGKTADGRDILGPWARWQEATAGGMRIHSEPDMDEQMTLFSQSGTVGEASIALPATYDKDHDAPSDSSEIAVFERGNARLEMGPDGFRFIGPAVFQNTVLIESRLQTNRGIHDRGGVYSEVGCWPPTFAYVPPVGG